MIASRMLLRLALLAASLAWASIVFTNTIGDPGRGERIAAAVLDDDDARAEITAPITSAVMAATGLPPDRAATVDAAVDRVLRDPDGARAFVQPFAGSWARLLGEDDPRATEFDPGRIVDQLETQLAAAGVDVDLRAAGLDEPADVTGVPLPRTELGWMDDVRRGIAAAGLPLAVVAAGLGIAAFALGDRRRVARRAGIWGVVAGGTWVVIPPLVVWTARSWAPGADAVVAAALDEATSGLFVIALALVIGGVAAIAASLVAPAGADGPPVRAREVADRRTSVPAPSRSVRPSPSRQPVARPTAPMPPVEAPETRRDPPGEAVDDPEDGSVWDFYR